MKKNLSIIIVHWNTPELLKNQLSLLAKNSKFHIIVVDNASKKSPEWIKKDFPSVELIQNKFNTGYAFACNQGVLKAEGNWLLFLNPDAEITPQQIQQMITYANKNNLDACSIKIDESYNKPLPTWLSLLCEFTPMNRFIGNDIFSLKTLFGGCLLVKRSALLELGGWDERFFLWFEDSDLTYRLIQNNYKIGWVNMPVKHTGGEAFKKIEEQYKRDIFFHSMDVFARKHFSIFGQLIVNLIKKRYTSRKLLPEIFAGTSITLPNLKRELLESFFLNNELHTSGVQWIVVTSSIVNSDIWEWRKQYPEIRFIQIEENKGFAPTVNIGFRVSNGRWVGTVNDDILLTKDWLAKILATPEKKIGSANPVIKQESGKIESAGIKILAKGKAEPIAKLVPKTFYETDATNAAAVVYAKNALNKVGLFDERFGSYLEDVDLSLRLKRAGYKNIVCLNSNVTHIGQSSSKDIGIKKQLHDFRNWIYVILKNWSLKDLVLNIPSIFVERLRNISGILKNMF